MDDNIFVSSNAGIECDELAAIVCDGKKGLDCTDKNSDFSKAKDLEISFGEFKVTFKPQEYLYSDKDRKGAISCRFGDPEGLRGGRICDADKTEFAVGKLFFEKLFPVLTFN